jgi:hypothetical protein
MNVKLLSGFAAFGLVVTAGVAALTGPREAAGVGSCQRTVSITPQVSAAEGAGTLTFAVMSRGCAAAGYVSYVVTDRSARRPADFMAGNGQLQFGSGDTTDKYITVRVVSDTVPEAALEDFGVQLVNPSPAVTVERGTAQGRILDDDAGTQAVLVDDQSCPAGQAPTAAQMPQAWPSAEHAVCEMGHGNIAFVRNIAAGPANLQLQLGPAPGYSGGNAQVSFQPGELSAYLRFEVPPGFSGRIEVRIVQASNGALILDPSAILEVRSQMG